MINDNLKELLIKLRLFIGYLGEKKQFGWWQSSFLSPEMDAFLGPIFPRTMLLAAYQGAIEAAVRIHDERIGIGTGVFHLFRLPRPLERELHNQFNNGNIIQNIFSHLTDRDTVLKTLKGMNSGSVTGKPGPISLGKSDDIYSEKTWFKAAAYYHAAFSSNQQTFPFLKQESHGE